MVRSVEGVYRNGKVELLESAPTDAEARVIVTFVPPENGANRPSDAPVLPRRFMIEWANGLPPGPRSFPSWAEVESHLQAERDAWDC